MAAQLNYNYFTDSGVPGDKYDLSETTVVTRHVEKDGLAPGVAAMKGSKSGVTVAAEGEVFEGVVLNGGLKELNEKGEVIFSKGDTVNIIKKGKVWVSVTKNGQPKKGDAAYVTKKGDEVGYFTTEKNENLDVGAVFVTEVDNGIAVVELK